MNKALLLRKLLEKIAKEEFKIKSSNMHPSDADWYIGFGDDVNTANESEYDPKTGKVLYNTSVGDYTKFLQQWDPEPEGYLEEEDDVKRDSGTYSFRINNLLRAYANKTD